MEFIIGAAVVIGLLAALGKLSAKSEEADKWLQERRQSAYAEQAMAAQSNWKSIVGDARTYPVGIVGESNYQDAITFLREGEIVELWHEPGNPYDDRAIAVAADDGDTIGYIPRDFWLREALLDEGKPYAARISKLAKGPKAIGVTIEVALVGKALRQRPFKPAKR